MLRDVGRVDDEQLRLVLDQRQGPVDAAHKRVVADLVKESRVCLFCSTSLQLASTRWVRLTLSSLCPLIQAVSSINLSNIKRKILRKTENQTRAAGREAAMPPL